MSNKYASVTVISQFKITYMIPVDQLQEMNPDLPVNPVEWAEDTVTNEDTDELAQKFLGEVIVNTEVVDEEKMLEIFDRENPYLKDWTTDRKIKHVRKLLSMAKNRKDEDARQGENSNNLWVG